MRLWRYTARSLSTTVLPTIAGRACAATKEKLHQATVISLLK